MRERTLPPGTARSGPAPSPAPGVARILVVDDHPDNREILARMLHTAGYEVETAEDGAAAVGRYRAGAFHVVLMDVQMPVMDGHAAATAIRAIERAEGRPPVAIVALTANVQPDDVAQARAAGCDAHLGKPCRRASLLETVARYVRSAATPAA